MKILVTGGAGYIGSHTCKYLASAGHVPVVFDDLSQGHEWAVKWGPFERGSLNDPARLDDVLARHKVDAVVHFAASALVGACVAVAPDDPLPATAHALSILGVCGERAARTAAAPGSFRMRLLDALFELTPAELRREGRIAVER